MLVELILHAEFQLFIPFNHIRACNQFAGFSEIAPNASQSMQPMFSLEYLSSLQPIGVYIFSEPDTNLEHAIFLELPLFL